MAGTGSEFNISVSAVQELLRAHDGDVALLWLWKLAAGGAPLENAARDLCMTMSQVRSADEKLSRLFQLPPQASVPACAPVPVPAPADELPQYSAADVQSALRGDSGFQAVLQEAESLLSKRLNRPETERLLGIYSHLGFSPEVLFVLLHYCADVSRGPEGAERKPTMSFIEKQAYFWANRGIRTVEEAEAFSESEKARLSSLGRIKKILEIYDRNLISSEESSISSWLNMGFGDDAIRLAYELTIEKTGKRAFPYMSRILQSWHEAGLHTLAEIEADGCQSASGRVRGKNGPKKPFIPTEF